MTKFLVDLSKHHEASGLMIKEVAEACNVSTNTVKRFIQPDKIVPVARLDGLIVRLARLYGVDWRDVVVVVWDDAESKVDGEIKTPLEQAVA